MRDLSVIQTALEQTARRSRVASGFRSLWFGLLAGAAVTLLAVASYKVFPFDFRFVAALSLAGPIGAVIGFLIGWLPAPDLPSVARWLDARLSAQERLATAWELSAAPGTDAWRDLVLADAATVAKSVDPQRLAPLGLSRFGKWSFLVIACCLGLGLVPEYRSASQLQRLTDRQNIRGAGQQLNEITRRSLEHRQPLNPQAREALEAVRELGIDFEKKSLTREAALQDLARTADLLKSQAEQLAKNPLVQTLQQAARQGGQPEVNPDSLRSRLEALKKTQPTEASPEQLEKLQSQLEKMQAAADGSASRQDAAGAGARQELAQSLGALGKEAQDLGLALPQLEAAIAALAANQPSLVMKDLQSALSDLEKLRETAKNLQQMQAQLEKLGKNLAEQLSKGQVEAAQTTLLKMARDLERSGLSQEEMKRLLEEVQQSLDPASKYGDVSKDLKQAMQQMQAKRPGDAGKSLQAAAAKLESLMQQLGDTQQMLAAMENLNDATTAICSGEGWRPGKSAKAGTKANRLPGGGVGTWAADDQGDSAEQTGRWDNSGIDRPEMQARGQTDRGEGRPVDGMKPDKVKGSFSPGGPMPSVTLKGVSIKGQSRVAVEAAAVAAQSEAQSALTQDKVPRAYQGAVRQYFDDIKK